MSKQNKIIFVLFFLLIVYIGVVFERMASEKEEEQKLTYSLLLKKNQIDAWLYEKKQLIKNLGDSLELVNYDKESHLPFMRRTLKIIGAKSIFGGFKDGQYIDTQGYWIEGFDPRARPWYQETIDSSVPVISGPMYYTDITGEKITWWSVSSAILQNTKPFGVISAEILPSMIHEHLAVPEIKNVENWFIFHKETGLIIASMQRLEEEKQLKEIYSQEFFEHIISRKNEKTTFSVSSRILHVYTKELGEVPWILCVIKEK